MRSHGSIKTNHQSVFLWVTLALISLLGFHLAADDNSKEQPKDDGYAEISQLMNIMQLVREKYVDVDEVTYKKLVHNAIKGMLRGLDPFSSYLEPDFFKQMVQDTNGKQFAGLGIHIAVKNGKLKIIAPMQGGPAFKAGIKPNDTVLFIDGKPTSIMSMDDCIKLLKGEPGTSITLTIFRPGDKVTKDIKIVREIITPSTVTSKYLRKDNIGYIRIAFFNKTTAIDMDKALDALKEKHIAGLIIDVRGNPGGLLDSAVQVCSRFIPEGKLIVFTQGRTKTDRQNYYSLDCTKTLKLPVVILVNGNSASAAEILSGCLQDHKRAVLIGEKTFGKGSVQSIIPLPDRGAVRLTIAKYYTPSKRVIHGHGLQPDVVVDIDAKTANMLYSQAIAYPGEVAPDAPGAVRDVQMERAIEILKGIILLSSRK